MRSTTILFIAILILLKFQSCLSIISIDIPGFYSRYEKLDDETKRKVVFISDNNNICDIENNYKIYSITASHLLNCLKKIIPQLFMSGVPIVGRKVVFHFIQLKSIVIV
jgi:hypothetical protein